MYGPVLFNTDDQFDRLRDHLGGKPLSTLMKNCFTLVSAMPLRDGLD